MKLKFPALVGAMVFAIVQLSSGAGNPGDSSGSPAVSAPQSAAWDGPSSPSAVPEAKTWILIGLGLGFTLYRMSAHSRRLKRFGGR